MSSKDDDTLLSWSFCFELDVCLHYWSSAFSSTSMLVIARLKYLNPSKHTIRQISPSVPIRTCVIRTKGVVPLLAGSRSKAMSLIFTPLVLEIQLLYTLRCVVNSATNLFQNSSKTLQTLLYLVTFVNFVLSVSIGCSSA
jgi:hypothetical protein